MFSDVLITPHSSVVLPQSEALSGVASSGAPILAPAVVLCLIHIPAPFLDA